MPPERRVEGPIPAWGIISTLVPADERDAGLDRPIGPDQPMGRDLTAVAPIP
jgi:hypothetical protein